jgi:hypothetical protein
LLDVSLSAEFGVPPYTFVNGSQRQLPEGKHEFEVQDSAGQVAKWTWQGFAKCNEFDLGGDSPEIELQLERNSSCGGNEDGRVVVFAAEKKDEGDLETFHLSQGRMEKYREISAAGGPLAVRVCSKKRGCSQQVEIEVLTNPAFHIIVYSSFDASRIFGQFDFRVETANGVAPFEIEWNDMPLLNEFELKEMPAGKYKILTKDANECASAYDIDVGDQIPFWEQELCPELYICFGKRDWSWQYYMQCLRKVKGKKKKKGIFLSSLDKRWRRICFGMVVPRTVQLGRRMRWRYSCIELILKISGPPVWRSC